MAGDAVPLLGCGDLRSASTISPRGRDSDSEDQVGGDGRGENYKTASGARSCDVEDSSC